MCLEVDSETVSNPYKGDLNKDGYITRADAQYLLKYSAKLETGITIDNSLTDLNNDGKSDSADARIVLNIATNINDYRNYMSSEPDGVSLQDIITWLGEEYLYNCNTLNVGKSITITPNFELSGKNSITNKSVTAQSSDTDVATVEIVDNTKIKVTAKNVGDVQIIVTSSEDSSIIGVLNLRIRREISLIGNETVSNYNTGDINADGIITDYDAMELLRYVAGLNSNLDETELDIDGNGTVDAADARRILRLSKYLNGDLVTLDSTDILIWRK